MQQGDAASAWGEPPVRQPCRRGGPAASADVSASRTASRAPAWGGPAALLRPDAPRTRYAAILRASAWGDAASARGAPADDQAQPLRPHLTNRKGWHGPADARRPRRLRRARNRAADAWGEAHKLLRRPGTGPERPIGPHPGPHWSPRSAWWLRPVGLENPRLTREKPGATAAVADQRPTQPNQASHARPGWPATTQPGPANGRRGNPCRQDGQCPTSSAGQWGGPRWPGSLPIRGGVPVPTCPKSGKPATATKDTRAWPLKKARAADAASTWGGPANGDVGRCG